MHDLFTRGVTPHGILRAAHAEAPQLYKESLLGWIPKEWEVGTTKEVATRIWIGLVTTMTKHYVTSGVKLIRNQNIREQQIETTDLINLSQEFAALHESRKFRVGDIVTVHTGDVGTSAVIDNHFEGAHGFATINTRVNVQVVNNQFLCNFYNSSIFKQQVFSVVTGDGRDNLNLKDFLKLWVAHRKDFKEQESIGEILEAVRRKIDSNKASLLKFLQSKDGLMNDLLTGRVRVKVAESAAA